MVSPSKAQQQQQQQQQQQPQENRSRETDRRSHVRIQKGPKPLEKNTFYLDIKNHVLSNKLEAKIKDLGGRIELFFGRSVTLVVSDRVDKSGQTSGDKVKWGWVSGGSGGLPSLRSVELPTPTPTPPTPSPAAESPLANSTNLRGIASRPKSRADAMLERALTQPQQYSVDPLKNAQNWGIPIWPTSKLQIWLDKIYVSLKGTCNLKQIQQLSVNKDTKVKQLKAPYIKFESFQRDTKPIFLELPAWPQLNFEGEPGTCPFDTKQREKKEITVSSKDIKENKKVSILNQQDKDKDMTRRPRGGATRTRRTEQLVAGYCEICRIDYRDLKKHVRSDQHLNFVRNDDNFLSLDTLINAGASVEAFLKFNRSKDIDKDCSLFPNVSRSLRSVVLPEEKVDKSSKPELDSYNASNIDMVQCNGARRSLDLKLNPSHNLRTRAKHESGHLLRSKGSPWHEVDKSDKFYDKFEGFTIKKRAKGTIWIEEDDPDDKCVNEDSFKVNKSQEYNKTGSIDDGNDVDSKVKQESQNTNGGQTDNEQNLSFKEIKCELNHVYELNCLADCEVPDRKKRFTNTEDSRIPEEGGVVDSTKLEVRVNGQDAKIEDKHLKANKNIYSKETTDSIHRCSKSYKNSITSAKCHNDINRLNGSSNDTPNVQNDVKDSKALSLVEKDLKEENTRIVKPSRRGGRLSRGRNRLSVEERLIEDNRAYYKVEVLGNKLRSSTIPNSPGVIPLKEVAEDLKKYDTPSSEKPVVVRFKRVRKSELSLLSDEAESFMFGEPKRDESSDCSESDQQSSTLPNDTESERDLTSNSFTLNSMVNCSSSVCDDTIEEDSQDSVSLGRARKRRRTQAEAFIKDNEDYYKFQTPGSRLRYQAPTTGVKESGAVPDFEENNKLDAANTTTAEAAEPIFSSKPSPEVEKLQFSFEAVPKSEPWYQTYQRQDEGAEFWHCFSEGDSQKPFLLPYEIENFHETLMRGFNKSENNRRRGRGRGGSSVSRSPRKSPRCHASTLAIMSTIIRKREQFQPPSLSIIEEETRSNRSRTNTPKSEAKSDVKSEIDEDLKQIAKNIDDMLCGKHFIGLEDSFDTELSTSIELNMVHPQIPKGPPPNLLELLDNCQDVNCLENSSCASSECGETTNIESPMKRRKRRKNRTGWPGIKMRKKLQAKQSIDVDCELENVPEQKTDNRLSETLNEDVDSNRLRSDSDPRVAESNGDCRIHPEVVGENETANDLMDRIQGGRKSTDTCASSISYSYSKDENSFKRHRSREDVGKCLPKNFENFDNLTKSDRNSDNNDANVSKSNRDLPDKDLESHENSHKCTTGQTNVSKRQPHSNSMSRKVQRRSTSTSEFQEASIENEVHDEVYRNDCHPVGESRKQSNSSNVSKRHQNEDVYPVTCNSDIEEENRFSSSCRKDTNLVIGSRMPQINNTLSKRQRVSKDTSSDTHSSETKHKEESLEILDSKGTTSIAVLQKQSNTNSVPTKRQREETSSSEIHHSGFEDENSCKKDTNLNITSKKQQNSRKRQRRQTLSSEARDSDIEFTFSVSQRVSPVVSSVELENRRSSIEFQPVVRMTKIDDQVDMDNGVLSVTVASNRRLRSSASPRSNIQPPKWYRNTRGKFCRWIKDS
ncbi:uncharacterized protein LOC124298292 isoform X1 [Neodiprion virginianus]|uniref:uncharacterized protein LOC124298292 isoform X1 n=2 Tax=Neodiprion virginianus TaxID=2961670 RepID=UPI001EE769FD|nr:uncharacterized protein LOC124298292 isoform X1 [Neodiprion virginianus]